MLKIAHLEFESPFILAPLAGYTDLPFRLLCRNHGAGYCVSEMISCHGLSYRQLNTIKMLLSDPEERPLAFQIFGADPEIMAEASEIMLEHNPDMIDINMGCPAKKVTKKGAGAALMTTPDLAKQILKKITSRVSTPITVKFRSGKDLANINAVSFAKMVEDCGVAAITVHARTWAQGFSGTIDKRVIAEVKEAVSIPVIGNGDILTYQDGLQMMDETGCNGVMVGRGALGNPWVFSEKGRPQTYFDILAVAKSHLALIEKYLLAERLLGYIKNHMSRYFRDLRGSSAARQKIFEAKTLGELKNTMKAFESL